MARMQIWFTFSAILALLSCPGCASKSGDVRNLPTPPPSSSSEPGFLGGILRDKIQDWSDSYNSGERIQWW